MLGQRTVGAKVSCTGIGLHSGQKIDLTINPAEPGTGIYFVRTDLPDQPRIQAHATNVSATNNNTTIGSGVEVVHTVEHLLAVLFGLGIDNALIEINGPEVPIMDGSGASFLFLIREVGIRELNTSKKFLKITDTIKISHNNSWIEIHPCEHFEIESTIMFPHPVISEQSFSIKMSCQNFIKKIVRARTFGLLRDVDSLKRKGLIKGGSLENAIVLDDFQVVNQDGLRFDDEFVRHKILDTIGDFSLLGFEILGKIKSYKSGHYLHNQLCRKILANKECYHIMGASSVTTETTDNFKLVSLLPISY